METIRIHLSFDKTMYGLAGYKYGVEVFNEQVAPQLDYSKQIELIFPSNIEMIASSFIQGLFSEIVKKIGYQGVQEKFDFKGGKELGDIKSQILQDLL